MVLILKLWKDNMHFLLPNQNLENIKEKIQNIIKRPVYICSREIAGQEDCIFKFPNESQFRKINKLEMYLSQYRMGPCVESEGGFRKFILQPSMIFNIVFPVRGEQKEKIRDIFKQSNLSSRFPELEIIYLKSIDIVPEELRPFVIEKSYPRRGMRLAIRFAISEDIVNPQQKKENWHLGFDFSNKEEKRISLQAPGYYPLNPISNVEAVNRICVVIKQPADCICCHGQSGEKKHLSFMQSSGHSAYPTGDICLKCLPSAMDAWKKILMDIE